MGSWYGTCGMTQMPLVREKVVMVPLQLSHTSIASGRDHCYPTDLWEPNGVAVYGEYSDYGEMSIEADQQRMHHVNVFVIADDLVERPAIDTYEPELSPDTIKDIEVYQAAIHSERLCVRQNSYATNPPEIIEAPVARMFILRTVWDELVKNGPKPRWSGDRVYDKAYYRNSIVDLMSSQAGTATYDEASRAMYNSSSNLRSIPFMVRRLISQLEGKQRDVFVDQYADQMAELMVISNLMHGLRKTWMPQAGAGSQDRDHHLHKVLIAAMQKSMAETREWEIENGWIDEDEEE